MLDVENDSTTTTPPTPQATSDSAPSRPRRRAASRPAGPPQGTEQVSAAESDTAQKKPKKASKKPAKKATEPSGEAAEPASAAADAQPKSAKKTAKAKTAKKSTSSKAAKSADPSPDQPSDSPSAGTDDHVSRQPGGTGRPAPSVSLLFQAPEAAVARARTDDRTAEGASDAGGESEGPEDEGTSTRRRRSRGGRNRRKRPDAADGDGSTAADQAAADDIEPEPAEPDAPIDTDESTSSRRRRRRRRSGEGVPDAGDDPADTVVRVRSPRAKQDSISSVEGSTRIEAKKQRRREGREAGRRRPPILSESEFLARRESVERMMVIRQRGETTQIAVLEDNVLVEHYVALESQTSLIGNVYLGRVQNVLPSMEAAFIDIGRGRNAVLYAGEVNWDLVGDSNTPRRIENALKPGQAVMVQVSKDPIGHKGARLTSQISLPGRYLVLVPGGGTSGISRKLPDTERSRLKNLLKEILPDDAGVIIRTAAEGASEEELTRDVTRLTARWEDISKKAAGGQAPSLLYAEPDTTLRVVRDLFTEDFTKLVISGEDAWDMVDAYVQHVAPDLAERLEKFDGDGDADVFANFRIDEQIAKALERKVWLPSGGSLVIDRTEAMTVIDVNTGKFTGSGGNLEETVTKNNLEAAEEIVRQLRLRDIGGIIVIDFIDMVLEGNRDLVLRRLVECLGRDRTRHQVAEVTSLGLVQMTRKRIGTGLLEAFSHTCEHCQGRGVLIEHEPIEPKKSDYTHSGPESGSRPASKRSSRSRRGRRSSSGSSGNGAQADSGSSGSGPDSTAESSPAQPAEANA